MTTDEYELSAKLAPQIVVVEPVWSSVRVAAGPLLTAVNTPPATWATQKLASAWRVPVRWKLPNSPGPMARVKLTSIGTETWNRPLPRSWNWPRRSGLFVGAVERKLVPWLL